MIQLAFLSQLAVTVVFHSKERPRVHAVFTIKTLVMTCFSADYETGKFRKKTRPAGQYSLKDEISECSNNAAPLLFPNY